MIDPRPVDPIAATRWAGRPLVRLASVASTNDVAREAARTGAPHGYAVVADAQTAGRGRRGRAWDSPPGASLYLSVLLRPSLEPTESAALTLFVGLAVARACDRFVPPGAVTVKWPNDVRIHRKKSAGILVEGSVRDGRLDAVIVGIGLNVAEHEELERAVDAMTLGGAPRREAMDALRARCDTLGTRVAIDGIEGVAEDIEDDGALRVLREDQTRVSIRSGEIA
jgi:BirA family biotin operon repressor/biotin-[acetyl-CoA-carboxylase] ligase